MQVQSSRPFVALRTLGKSPSGDQPSFPAEKPDIWHDGRPWDPRQQPAQLVGRGLDGKETYSGVRWGWTEIPRPGDWVPTFQNTTVDPARLKDVHFYIEHFFPAGHAALVFEFQGSDVVGADGRATDKMVYSIEAKKKVGEKWTPQHGLKKTMGIVEQLMTFEDAKQWVTRHQGASFETRRLKLTDDEKQALLKTCLEEAVRHRTGEYYHTTRNSCYSGLQKVLNKALPEHKEGLKSPLSFGVLMKPEAVMTSNYNTVLKHMGLWERQHAHFYAPDAELHPAEHAKAMKNAEPSFLKTLGEQAWMPTVARVAGAALGGAIGYGVTDNLLALGVGGYVGWKAGAIGGDLVESRALRTIMNP